MFQNQFAPFEGPTSHGSILNQKDLVESLRLFYVLKILNDDCIILLNHKEISKIVFITVGEACL